MKKLLLMITMLLFSVLLFASEESIYFIQVTDTHFGFEENWTKKQQARHYEKLKTFVSEINNLTISPEFIVFTGDVENEHPINQEMYNKTFEIIKGIKYTIYYIPGNHDINPERLETIETSVSDFKKNFGELNFAKEIKGVDFLFMYDENLRKNIVIKDYDNLKWLKEELDKNGTKPAIVFFHSPPGKSYYDNKISTGWDSKNEEKFNNVINGKNVKAVITGHFHVANMTYAGEVPVYVSPSFMEFDGGTYKYRIYEYENGKLSYYAQEIQ